VGHGSGGSLQGLAEVQQVQAAIDEYVANIDTVRILEAGCGSLSRVNLGDHKFVVGLDIDAPMLDKNDVLDEKILGDVQSYEFPPDSFDLIVCWYVFEHLPHPEEAMARFAHAIRPGGLIVLALPNVMSIKGLITKYTPFRFHVWFRRNMLGVKNAGTPGHGPFPTFLPFSISPDGMRTLANRNGLSITYLGMFEDNQQVRMRKKFHVTGKAWSLVQRATRLLTAGRVESAKTECVIVLRSAIEL
jgi:SAM-dependent methyltransferase